MPVHVEAIANLDTQQVLCIFSGLGMVFGHVHATLVESPWLTVRATEHANILFCVLHGIIALSPDGPKTIWSQQAMKLLALAFHKSFSN